MNIAIIGSGYVGTAVAKYWQQKMTFIVSATTTTPERIPTLQTVAQRVAVVQGNDAQALKSVLHNQDVVLVSVAAKGKPYEQAYLQTAKTLVDILPEIPTIKQVIYTSSCSVYGNQNGAVVDEETQVAAMSDNTKVLSETEQLLLTSATNNRKVCILRLAGIYGPGRELIKIFGKSAGSTRPGTGTEPTNWIHLDDIVGTIEFARQHQLQGIYNVVDDGNLTSKELLDILCETHNLPKFTWDTSVTKRSSNARLSNQKLKASGYKLIHPEMMFK